VTCLPPVEYSVRKKVLHIIQLIQLHCYGWFFFGDFHFPRHSPLFFCLPVDSPLRFHTTNRMYILSFLFFASACSTSIPCILASIVSSSSSSSPSLGSPSSCGHHQRQWWPLFILQRTWITSTSSHRFHSILQVPCALYWLLAAKFGRFTNVLVSDSTRYLTLYR